jgi:hypothetical protein
LPIRRYYRLLLRTLREIRRDVDLKYPHQAHHTPTDENKLHHSKGESESVDRGITGIDSAAVSKESNITDDDDGQKGQAGRRKERDLWGLGAIDDDDDEDEAAAVDAATTSTDDSRSKAAMNKSSGGASIENTQQQQGAATVSGWGEVSYSPEVIDVMCSLAEVDEWQGRLSGSARKWRAVIRAQEEMYKYTHGNGPAAIAASVTRLAYVLVREGERESFLMLISTAKLTVDDSSASACLILIWSL